MKILHLIDTLGKGGAEVLLINCIKEFKLVYPESKHYIFTLKKGSDGELSGEAKCLGLYMNLGVTQANVVAKALAFRSYVKKNKIDVIHTHLLDSMLFARMAKPVKVKLVSTYHSVYYKRSNIFFSWWRMHLDRLTYSKKNHIIFVSDTVAENIKPFIGIAENSTVLVNFAGREFKHSYTFDPSNRLKLISIGNLKSGKNHELAISVLAEMKANPVELHIYGDGELYEHLQGLIKTSGANVTLKGIGIITSALLSQYDAFLMTSLNEGMPISLIEAILTGLPSILNDLPTLRETAKDAAIYYKTNSGEELKNVLKNVLKNKEVLRDAAKETLKISNCYNAEKYVKTLHAIYLQAPK